MFAGCSSLANLDLSSFDTKNVGKMNCMFYGCTSLDSLMLSNFTFKDSLDTGFIFSDCHSLSYVGMQNVKIEGNGGAGLFESSKSKVKTIDLSNANITKATTLDYMFFGCSFLETIYATNWDVKSCSTFGMFSDCNNLKGSKGSKIGANLYGYGEDGNPLYYNCPTDGSAAHIDGGKDNPGLFTAK